MLKKVKTGTTFEEYELFKVDTIPYNNISNSHANTTTYKPSELGYITRFSKVLQKLRHGEYNIRERAKDFVKRHKVVLGGTALFGGLVFATNSLDGISYSITRLGSASEAHVYEFYLNPLLHPISHVLHSISPLLEEVSKTYTLLHGRGMAEMLNDIRWRVSYSVIKNLPYYALLSYGPIFGLDKLYRWAKRK